MSPPHIATGEDQRFYTPRAQASTARSTASSFVTPRSDQVYSARSGFGGSSSSESEYTTPRNGPPAAFWGGGGGGVATSSYHPPPPAIRPNISQHRKAAFENFRNRRFTQSAIHSYQQQLSPNTNASNYNDSHQLPPQYPNYYHNPTPPMTNQKHHNVPFNHSAYDDECNDNQQSKFSHNENRLANTCHNQQDIDDIFSFTRHGKVEAVNNLLIQGVPVDIKDNDGNSILAVACQNGNKRLMKLALRYDADINACNFRGNTALHFCYKYGSRDTLGAYLIRKGADVSVRNKDGQTCEVGFC